MKHRKIKIGDKYDRLEIIEYLGIEPICKNKSGKWYKCKCECEKFINLPGIYIGRSHKSCGCLQKESREKIIETGTQFERLIVLSLHDTIKGRGHRYLCRCSCKKETEPIVRGDQLRSGDVGSCGCLHDELFQANVKKAYENNFVMGTSIPKITSDKLQKNNTSGVKGVNWHKRMKKWNARISFKKTNYSLGYYNNKNDAIAARKEAEEELFGNFLEWYEVDKKIRKENRKKNGKQT